MGAAAGRAPLGGWRLHAAPTLEFMDTTQLALLALLAGVVIGGSISAVIVASLRMRDRARAETSLDIPDGVREVLHGMDDAAVVVDASFTILAASAAALPFSLSEGAALPSDELRAVARSVRTADAAATSTLRLRRGAPPAEPRLVVVRATRISPRLTLLVIRDITERERVEQMRRDFVANTSHELKTPVGAVSLLAEAIESAADDPPQVRIFAARLTAEASRLALLTSRIMNLSRLQAADELTEERIVAVDEIVASAVDAHAIQADSAGVEVVRGGARGLHVRGDAQVLSEAVGNLIANAIAYSPQRLERRRRGEARRRSRRDRGHRSRHRHRRGRPGAGVRAVLSRRPGAFATHRRHGSRSVDRQARGAAPRRRGAAVVAPGAGFDLHDPPSAERPPRRPAEAEAQSTQEACDAAAGIPSSANERRSRMTRVLIVEDEPDLADPLAYLLRREAYEVEIAEDGPAALVAFRERGADIILLDLMLPGMPGTEVCRQVRTTSSVPIIMLTAKDSEVDIVVGLELGADDYVTKPYSSRELLARMRAVLRRFAQVDADLDERVLDSGRVVLDIDRHTVAVEGREISMPLKEFELLEVLMRNAGRVLTRGQLIDRVWGSDYFGDTKTLDVHIKRIRSRIEENPERAVDARDGARARLPLRGRDQGTSGARYARPPSRTGTVTRTPSASPDWK